MCRVGQKRKKCYNIFKRLSFVIILASSSVFFIFPEIEDAIYFAIYGFAAALIVLWNFKDFALSIRTKARMAEDLIANISDDKKFLFYRIYILMMNIAISLTFAYCCYYVRTEYKKGDSVMVAVSVSYSGYCLCKALLNGSASYLVFCLTKIKRAKFGPTVAEIQGVKREIEIEMQDMGSAEVSYNADYINEV